MLVLFFGQYIDYSIAGMLNHEIGRDEVARSTPSSPRRRRRLWIAASPSSLLYRAQQVALLEGARKGEQQVAHALET